MHRDNSPSEKRFGAATSRNNFRSRCRKLNLPLTNIITFFLFVTVISEMFSQNLLRNGSFELPQIPPNSLSGTTPQFWKLSGAPFVIAATIHSGNSGSASVWPLAEGGQQFANCGNDGSRLTQDFTVTTGGSYELSWWDSSGHAAGLMTSPWGFVYRLRSLP